MAQVLLGVEAEPDLWSYAGLPAALPPGPYHIEVPLLPRDAEQAALGWLLGSYRYTRSKKAEGERPPLLAGSSRRWPRRTKKRPMMHWLRRAMVDLRQRP